MNTAAEQMDMFAALDGRDPLDDLVRHVQHEGARLRIFAALTYPHFQQYADQWMRHEYTGGTYSSFRAGGKVLEYDMAGAACTVDGERYAYTWKQMTDRARKLIEEPDWLSRDEEWIVNDLGGELPYPYACSKYPEEAWWQAPPMFMGICTRCGSLNRASFGHCERCWGKVRKLTFEEVMK